MLHPRLRHLLYPDHGGPGIIGGYTDGTFKPNDQVTRADFALMTVRMLGVDEDGLEFTTTAFTDVNDETYNAAAIQYCAEKVSSAATATASSVPTILSPARRLRRSSLRPWSLPRPTVTSSPMTT